MEKEDILAYVHANDELKANEAVKSMQKAYTIVNNKVNKPKYILGIIE